ncbi:zinc ABC transporter substrate-binding protein [bacterium]|nr:MAG: zinc ABC transporter substrate-binding protein [bacterium]
MFGRRVSALIFSISLMICYFVPIRAYASRAKDINIVTSFYPVYIMAKNVARDVPGVSVRNLTPALTGCLHDYTVTSDDMKKLAGAQLFVVNGAGMESFLDKIIAQHPDLRIIQLSEGISLIKGKGNSGDNPHVWVSVSNAIIQVKNLGKAMEEFDPLRKELYAKNTADYAAKLEGLRRKMHSELAAYKGRPMVTFHEAFPYFAREFDLNIVAVVEREPASEPSARELADTVEIIRRNDIAALFSEPQYSASAARAIAEETGAKIYVLDPAVTGPDDYDAYINIMENNLVVLKKAFAQ